jgi:16S rRNA processing protein RimM
MAGTSSWRSRATTERLAVARVLGAKGLAGAFRIEPLTDVPERLSPGSVLYLEGEANPVTVTEHQAGGRVPVLSLAGVTSREAAEALTGRYLEVEAAALPEGSWYWHQIVGLRVVDERGAQLGSVVEVFRAGENAVYRIEGPAGELLIPALRDVVLGIDTEAGSMTVRWDPEEVR